MKKYLNLVFLIVFLHSCEKDDFCTQNPVTSKLIIKFMNDTKKKEGKAPNNIDIWAKNKDTLYVNSSLDSLALPLNSEAKETVYHFQSEKKISTIKISYNTKKEFISRSCGYRVLFENVTISEENLNWIKSVSPNTLQNINNQNKAHVKIFH